MATDIKKFPFKGLEIEVFQGDEYVLANIKFAENDVIKEYHINGFKTNKTEKTVFVEYNKLVKDSKGNVLNQDINQSFEATKQESTAYFYNLPADKLGLKIDQMCINGLLLELFGTLCFNPSNGEFYPPISADVEITPITFTDMEHPVNKDFPPAEDAPEFERRPEIPKSNDDGIIKVTPVDILGTPTFKLTKGEEEFENETGIFEDLEAGEYSIEVTSDEAEIPFRTKVTL